MGPRHFVCVALLLSPLLIGGCARRHSGAETRHPGPKLNIPDFLRNTAAYKGKTITLDLKVDEASAPSQGQSVRDWVGRDVKFIALGPKGERLDLVIAIPKGLAVPDVAATDTVSVRFVCTLGTPRQGNKATSIQKTATAHGSS